MPLVMNEAPAPGSSPPIGFRYDRAASIRYRPQSLDSIRLEGVSSWPDRLGDLSNPRNSMMEHSRGRVHLSRGFLSG